MFLCVGAMERQRYYQSTLTIVKTWMSTINMGCPVSRFYPGVDGRKDMLARDDYMTDARGAGVQLMRLAGGRDARR